MKIAVAQVFAAIFTLAPQARSADLPSLPLRCSFAAFSTSLTPSQTDSPMPNHGCKWNIDGVVVADSEAKPQLNPLPPKGEVFAGCPHPGAPTLRFRVMENGTLGAVRVVRSSGCPAADRRLLEAARDWRYWPAIRNQRSVPSVITTTISVDGD
jgi:TonB family protein